MRLLERQVRRLPTTALEANVLRRVGVVPRSRPDEMIWALLAVRRWGLVAGPAMIAARRHPSAPGVIDELGELSFAELDERTTRLANAWMAEGVAAGSVVALLCRNHRYLIEAMIAGAKLGAKVLLMNTGFAKPQFAAVALREGVSALVYDEEFTAILDDVPADIPRYLGWTDAPASDFTTVEQLIATGTAVPLPRPSSTGSLILLTSGTTGTPKGAPRQVSSPFSGAQFLDRIPLRPGQRTFFGAPLFHGTGLSQFLVSMALGSTIVLRRRFDPVETLAAVEKHRAEALVLVPTMLQRILALDDEVILRYDTSALRIIFLSGSALAPEVGNHATRLFGDVIYNLYGSTEVAVATVATPEDWRQAPGTVGRAPVGCRVALYDDAGRRVTAARQVARVFVGSGLGFHGYTGGGSKVQIDGLLSSGDVGHFDEDGLLFIDGRDDDMIVSGGENVFPVEIENLLLEHPEVDDAAVVAVEDEEFGQRLKAFLVLKQGSALSHEDVRVHVKSNLARHKVPRDVEFIDELPRNATGKVLRRQLH